MFGISKFNIFRKKDKLENIWYELKYVDIEIKRQILNHELTYIGCGNQLTISPLITARNIINLGSGYGIWSYEFFKEYVGANIINIDIKKMDICDVLEKFNYDLPNRINIEFRKLDLKKTNLKIHYNTIDFVYQRDMLSIYNKYEWSNIVNEIYKVLKIGGYAEFVEFNFIINHKKLISNTYSNLINDFLISTFEKDNYIYDLNDLIKIIEGNIKLCNVNIINLPLYGDKYFNEICTSNLIFGYFHIKEIFEKEYGDFENFIENLKKEWSLNESYIQLYVISTQKIN